MKPRTWYQIVSAAALAIAGGSAILAVAGAALQQTLSATAASLCATVFLIPGLFFFAYQRRFRARDLALAHVAAIARARGTLELNALADELRISREDAEKVLRTAVNEGHLRGTFDARGRFIVAPSDPGGPAS